MSSTGTELFSTRYPQCVKPSTSTSYLLVIGVLFDSARDFRDLVINRATFFHEVTNLLVRVHHCCVVAITEELTNFWQR